ncbi:MAG: hypothetical protein K1000chlam3_00444 [Chlamydiae bacterium]|nr:hypothetical protein [Chlamydiota bacterium]
MTLSLTEEGKRLDEVRCGKAPWRLWGPYLSERQWGTVREDYSTDGSAWEFFPHDHARSRAYRWGEDGIAGISDDKQRLCFALALWNGKDPILKERLFGLTGSEGNHGEDVKEYYFYLDNVPTHAYMKYLYKYPQEAYPYADLVEENKKRTHTDPEYELLDTGIFDEDRYFDVFVEYAKDTPEDILIQISVANRGPESATLHLLPTLWFRNMWSYNPKCEKPKLILEKKNLIKASHPDLGVYWLYCDQPKTILFTENETDKKRIFHTENDTPYVKDGFHKFVIQDDHQAVNPDNLGTKAAAHHILQVGAGETVVVKLYLSTKNNLADPFGKPFEEVFEMRKTEAEDFYQQVTPYPMPEDMRNVQRQAFAGLLWNKQLYHYDVRTWLKEDSEGCPPPEERKKGRNSGWWNLDGYDVFSMPDKWEYPWFAAWDLSFHTVAIALIDPDFAKNQLLLLNKEWYMHPDGQIPAYEWAFSDVNPPVQAWAALRIYQIEKALYGRKDRSFLEKIFQKLSLNFTWWVNRKDADNRNVFEGGFLGLDNIGAFDRDEIPKGGTLYQVDGTAWMGMYCLNMLQIALELAIEDPVYEDMATKFFEHFVYIADAINNIGDHTEGLWDEEKGFYYSLLKLEDGTKIKIETDTLVGLVPLFAVAPNNPKINDLFPDYRKRFQWFVENEPELLDQVLELDKKETDGSFMLSLVSPEKLKRILEKTLNEKEFLSPFGVRSVSQRHAADPFILKLGGQEFKLNYEPAESSTSLFGGNSNWRGPIWFPLNFLMIESLQKFHYYLDESYQVECPAGSGKFLSLWDVSMELTHRLIQIFLKDENGKRPVYGGIEKFQNDPHWQDYILFHEYFHGDNGAGLGASAQTGWTGLMAKLIQQYGEYVLQHKSPQTIEKRRIGPV